MDLFQSLAGSLVLTLVLELTLALMWGVEQRDWPAVVLANLLTNPVVVLCHHTAAWYLPSFLAAVTLALELCAMLTEGMIYQRRSQITRPWVFSLWANGLSFLTGFLL